MRTYVLHQHLLEHLPPAPASVLDIGGGAGHQSFPLAAAGYDVTLLDPSPAMLAKAEQRLQRLPDEARRRITLLEADGENAVEAVGGRRFAAVLCHGCSGTSTSQSRSSTSCAGALLAGGVVSIMTGNAHRDGGASRPGTALGRRPGGLRRHEPRSACSACRAGPTRWRNSASSSRARASSRCAGTACGCSSTGSSSAAPSWIPTMHQQVAATAAVELEASRRDPYRQLSRVFHLVGRKPTD